MFIAVRRSLAALGVAGIVALILKMRGASETPSHQGGWRELTGPGLR